jgi:hypothetical protein
MTDIINFAICRYVPSILRGEQINIGLVYHSPSLKLMDFISSKNTKRIKSFDDEIESDVINAIFESLNYEFCSGKLEGSLMDNNIDLTQKNLLADLTKGYVNQIQFEHVRTFELKNNLKKEIEDLTDMYLYYDKMKNERMNQDRVRALTARIINSSSYKDSFSKVKKNKEFFEIPYDFKIQIQGANKYIKAFSFDYKNSSKFYKEMKSYLFDLSHAKEHFGIDVSDVKIVINNTNLEAEHEKEITNHLPNELELFTLEKFSSFITQEEVNHFH